MSKGSGSNRNMASSHRNEVVNAKPVDYLNSVTENIENVEYKGYGLVIKGKDIEYDSPSAKDLWLKNLKDDSKRKEYIGTIFSDGSVILRQDSLSNVRETRDMINGLANNLINLVKDQDDITLSKEKGYLGNTRWGDDVYENVIVGGDNSIAKQEFKKNKEKTDEWIQEEREMMRRDPNRYL